MYRNRSIAALFGVSSLGLAAWLLPAAVAAPTHSNAGGAAAKVTTVRVTAGKPVELGFKLSKVSMLPAGPIAFKVTNVGYAIHDFKVCLRPVSSTRANACVGKKTKLLKRGQSATLTITLSKNGKYQFLCSVAGHAAAGMKGLLGVGVKLAATEAVAAAPASSSGSSASNTSASSSSSSSNSSSGSTAGSTAGGTKPAGGAGECPAGMTVAQGAAAFGEDHDEDDTGGPTDFDGCL
jgi:uncharacterized cupredoxin-like copper-binding protein